MGKTAHEIVQLFYEWLDQSSSEAIAENCRTEGTVFFKFMAEHGVDGRICRSIIKQATGYEPSVLWRVAPSETIKMALENYVCSKQGILAEENDISCKVPPARAIRIAKYFWEM